MDRGGRTTTLWAVGLVAAVAVLARMELPPGLDGILDVLPELLAAPAALLAVRLGRHRALGAAAIVVALNRVGGPDPAIAAAAAVLLAVLATVPSTRVTHPLAGLHVAATAAALPLLSRFWPAATAAGWPARLASDPWPSVIVGGCFAAAVLALLWRRAPLDLALPWLVAVVAATRLPAAEALLGTPQAIVLGAAQVLVVLTLIEDGHLLAFTDRLTSLPNRRALDDRLSRLHGRFTIAMIDIDHFKRFNDRWGHAAGDQALRLVAVELANVSGGGRAYRYGGEEFAIVFSGRTAREVSDELEAVRQAIADRGFVVRSPTRPRKKPRARARSVSRRVDLTVSIGAASPKALRPSPAEVLRAADRALYRAKRAGRNHLVLG